MLILGPIVIHMLCHNKIAMRSHCTILCIGSKGSKSDVAQNLMWTEACIAGSSAAYLCWGSESNWKRKWKVGICTCSNFCWLNYFLMVNQVASMGRISTNSGDKCFGRCCTLDSHKVGATLVNLAWNLNRPLGAHWVSTAKRDVSALLGINLVFTVIQQWFELTCCSSKLQIFVVDKSPSIPNKHFDAEKNNRSC